MSYRPKLGATPFAFKLDTEAAKKVIAATAAKMQSGVEGLPESLCWQQPQPAPPERQHLRVVPKKKVGENSILTRAFLEYDVPCTTENIEKYLFIQSEYDAAQDRLRWLIRNQPDLNDPVIKNGTPTTLVGPSGTSYGLKALKKRGPTERDMKLGRDMAKWVVAVVRQIERMYDAANVPAHPTYMNFHSVVPDSKEDALQHMPPWLGPDALESVKRTVEYVTPEGAKRRRTYYEVGSLLQPRGARRAPVLNLLPNSKGEWAGSNGKDWETYLKGRGRCVSKMARVPDLVKTIESGERKDSKLTSFDQLARYFAESGGIVAPIGTARLTYIYYLNMARMYSQLSMEQLIHHPLRVFIANLKNLLGPEYEKADLSPKQIETLKQIEFEKDLKSISGITGTLGSIGAIINPVLGVMAAAQGAIMIGLAKLVRTGEDRLVVPRMPFRRVIAQGRCDVSDIQDVAYADILDAAKFWKDQGIPFQPPNVADEGPADEQTAWDKYKWWIIGGGTALAATALAVPLLAKNEAQPHRRRTKRRRTSRRRRTSKR